jgi:E3 ubiquitin-protein ligase RNF14
LPPFATARRWCAHPGCGEGLLHEGGAGSPVITCPSCRRRTCFNHRGPFHDGQTCEQHDRAAAADLAWFKAHAKRCPRCGEGIQKQGGCDHMTCRRPSGCGHEFCWVCLADYGPIRAHGNHHHEKKCSYYRAKRG